MQQRLFLQIFVRSHNLFDWSVCVFCTFFKTMIYCLKNYLYKLLYPSFFSITMSSEKALLKLWCASMFKHAMEKARLKLWCASATHFMFKHAMEKARLKRGEHKPPRTLCHWCKCKSPINKRKLMTCMDKHHCLMLRRMNRRSRRRWELVKASFGCTVITMYFPCSI